MPFVLCRSVVVIEVMDGWVGLLSFVWGGRGYDAIASRRVPLNFKSSSTSSEGERERTEQSHRVIVVN